MKIVELLLTITLTGVVKPTDSAPVADTFNDHHPPARPYSFAYAVRDAQSSNDYGHQEISDGNVVSGFYHVLLPDGRFQSVSYKVDHDSGFVPEVKYNGEAKSYEPTDSRLPTGSPSTAPAYANSRSTAPVHTAPTALVSSSAPDSPSPGVHALAAPLAPSYTNTEALVASVPANPVDPTPAIPTNPDVWFRDAQFYLPPTPFHNNPAFNALKFPSYTATPVRPIPAAPTYTTSAYAPVSSSAPGSPTAPLAPSYTNTESPVSSVPATPADPAPIVATNPEAWFHDAQTYLPPAPFHNNPTFTAPQVASYTDPATLPDPAPADFAYLSRAVPTWPSQDDSFYNDFTTFPYHTPAAPINVAPKDHVYPTPAAPGLRAPTDFAFNPIAAPVYSDSPFPSHSTLLASPDNAVSAFSDSNGYNKFLSVFYRLPTSELPSHSEHRTYFPQWPKLA